VRVRDVTTGEESTLDVTGFFLAIGHDPATEVFRGQVELDDEGYVRVDSPHTRTNLDGVFAAGDVVDHEFRQAITAAGTGCAAALDAERWLADREGRAGHDAGLGVPTSDPGAGLPGTVGRPLQEQSVTPAAPASPAAIGQPAG
jgi:NADPH-dependent glutamate synthase beta subunit-like oxidoreductase